MRSLRGRLLIGLLVLVFSVDGLAGFFSYRRALQSTSILLDYQLYQMALSFRDQRVTPAAPQLLQGSRQFEFAIQITESDGRDIYSSQPGVDIGEAAASGYADLTIDNERWRSYSLTDDDRTIRVAQPWRVREDLAGSAAIRSLAPLLVLTPLLALAVWLMVISTLAPIERLVNEVRLRDADSLSPLNSDALPGELRPVVTEMNRLLERLRMAFQIQQSFISDAAHELRSPLTALHLQLQLLRRATDPAAHDDAVRELERVMERTSTLVQQMLTLARHEPGVESSPLVPVRLDRVVREVVTDCAAFAVSRNIDLELDNAPDATIQGDADSLRILVRNLVDNAIRYTPSSGVVSVRVVASGETVAFEVSDTGPGIDQEHRARIFDRFYRVGASTETGSGLGLAIVKAIAEYHHAEIALSAPDRGGLCVKVHFARLHVTS